MTKYYVYFIEGDFVRFRKAFDDKAETIKYVKSELEGTDGSFAFQIIGFDDGTPRLCKDLYGGKSQSKSRITQPKRLQNDSFLRSKVQYQRN